MPESLSEIWLYEARQTLCVISNSRYDHFFVLLYLNLEIKSPLPLEEIIPMLEIGSRTPVWNNCITGRGKVFDQSTVNSISKIMLLHYYSCCPVLLKGDRHKGKFNCDSTAITFYMFYFSVSFKLHSQGLNLYLNGEKQKCSEL